MSGRLINININLQILYWLYKTEPKGLSLGLVVMEEKLFTRTGPCVPTPQSDDIKNIQSFARIIDKSIS